MKGAGLFVFFCLCAQAQPGAIEGIAVNGVTGQPMSGVHIRIYSGGYETVSSAYGAMSDSTGHFSMAQVVSGTYIVTAERTGFVYLRKTQLVVLKAGERMANFKVEMVPRSTISGRIVDENGDPVPHVPVMLEPVSREFGPGTIGGMLSSDDRGEFRLRAGPGKFRVRAMPRDMYGGPAQNDKVVYGPTYFPGTGNRDQASIVETTAGAEISGLEIRLARSTGFVISGVVTGMPEGVMASVMLQSGDSPHRVTNSRGLGVQHDGRFNFGKLQPGYYRVFAMYSSPKLALQSTPVEFKLEADVSNLQLALAPGGEVAGTLEFAGGGVSTAQQTVRLKSDMQFFGRMPSAPVDEKGAFRISGVLPDRFRVQVDPLPDNAYVKSVQVDGAVVPDGSIDFSSGARDAKVKITIGRNGGQIAGSVVEPNGQPVQSPVASIYLLQDPEVRRLDPIRMSPDGKYSIKGIRPGKYRVLAIDPLRSSDGSGIDHLKELYGKAEEIEIKEGDRITKNIKVAVGESHGTK